LHARHLIDIRTQTHIVVVSSLFSQPLPDQFFVSRRRKYDNFMADEQQGSMHDDGVFLLFSTAVYYIP